MWLELSLDPTADDVNFPIPWFSTEGRASSPTEALITNCWDAEHRGGPDWVVGSAEVETAASWSKSIPKLWRSPGHELSGYLFMSVWTQRGQAISSRFTPGSSVQRTEQNKTYPVPRKWLIQSQQRVWQWDVKNLIWKQRRTTAFNLFITKEKLDK